MLSPFQRMHPHSSTITSAERDCTCRCASFTEFGIWILNLTRELPTQKKWVMTSPAFISAFQFMRLLCVTGRKRSTKPKSAALRTCPLWGGVKPQCNLDRFLQSPSSPNSHLFLFQHNHCAFPSSCFKTFSHEDTFILCSCCGPNWNAKKTPKLRQPHLAVEEHKQPE